MSDEKKESRYIPMHIKNKYIKIFLIFFILAAPFSVLAGKIHKASMREVRYYMRKYADMPVYCQCRLTEREITEIGVKKEVPETFGYAIKRWKEKVGESAWEGFHHYCFGIRRYREAIMILGTDKKAKKQKKDMLNWALSEFSQFRNSIDAKFPLWPNLLYYEAQIFIQLGRYDLANARKRQMSKFQRRKKSK